MAFEKRADMEKPWVLIAALATILAFFALACLVILYTSAPVNVTPPAAGPSYQAADEHVPSDVAEAERTLAAQTRSRPNAIVARQPAAPRRAEQTPSGPAAPRGAEPTPGEPAAPYQNPDDGTADQSSASEQVVFKARRALESIDPRELLRQGAFQSK